MVDEMTKNFPAEVRFQLLGPVGAYVNSTPVDLGTRRERRLLVAFLSAPNRRILRRDLVDWVWDDPPANPNRALDEVVTDLRRKRLDPLGLADFLISNRDGWCQFAVPPECVDASCLDALARRATASGESRRRELLVEAVQLRHGEPLEDLDGRLIDGYREKLASAYRRVEILFNQCDVRHGRGAERLTDLERLYRSHPMETRVAGLYMCALHYAGIPADALRLFQHHRSLLDEHGLVVMPQLTALQVRILRAEANISPEADFFLGGPPVITPEPAEEPAQDARSGDTAESESRRAAVTNIVTGNITGTYVLFGIDNRSS